MSDGKLFKFVVYNSVSVTVLLLVKKQKTGVQVADSVFISNSILLQC